MAKREHIAAILKMDSVEAAWKTKYDRLPGSPDIDHLYTEFQPLQLSVIRDFCDLIPGALTLSIGVRDVEFKSALRLATPVRSWISLHPSLRNRGTDRMKFFVPRMRRLAAPHLVDLRIARRCDVYPMSRIVKLTTLSSASERDAMRAAGRSV